MLRTIGTYATVALAALLCLVLLPVAYVVTRGYSPRRRTCR